MKKTEFEEFEERAEQESEKITQAFIQWYTAGKIEADLRKWLEDNTADFIFNTPAEFFCMYGLVEQGSENLTKFGKETLEQYETHPAVGTPAKADDRIDPDNEPALITPEEWTEAGYYAADIKADPGDAEKAESCIVTSYNEYREVREYFHEKKYYITAQTFQTPAEYFPGLLTFDAAVSEFSTADDRIIELKSFPEFSKTAKIKLHDSVVLAADTGAGKSSLAINFINDLGDDYPALYFNLEMDALTILRRLVAIRTGLELDRIEGYQKDPQTAATVNAALKAITARKPLQIVNDAYALEDIEKIIKKSTEEREEPTIVIIDHSLLVTTRSRKINGRYERFTHISEELRRISRTYNIILFVLLQQNREGKKDENERPKNYSLKESGSWENDGTHITFLWTDPTIKRKKLLITKNRHGKEGEFLLDYYPRTQTYREAKTAAKATGTKYGNTTGKKSKRDQMRDKLQKAYDAATRATDGNPTLHDIAEAADVTTRTIVGWIKELGGGTINGKQYDPAGIDEIVKYTGFVRLSLSEKQEVDKVYESDTEDIRL